eukprot:scaffold77481_cov64-Phaeocystis_antarctica.AAC.5
MLCCRNRQSERLFLSHDAAGRLPHGDPRLRAEGSLADKRVALQDAALQRILGLPHDAESLVLAVKLRHDAEALHPPSTMVDAANHNVAHL